MYRKKDNTHKTTSTSENIAFSSFLKGIVTAVFGRKNFAKNKKAEILYITRISAVLFSYKDTPKADFPEKTSFFLDFLPPNKTIL